MAVAVLEQSKRGLSARYTINKFSTAEKKSRELHTIVTSNNYEKVKLINKE